METTVFGMSQLGMGQNLRPVMSHVRWSLFVVTTSTMRIWVANCMTRNPYVPWSKHGHSYPYSA